MKGYASIVAMVFSVVAFLAPSAPSFAEDHVQFYVPSVRPMVLRFAAIDPARGAIDQHRLLQELTAAMQASSTQQLTTLGNTTTEISGLRTHLLEDQSQIVFEYVHLARNKEGDEWGETLTIPLSYRIQKSEVLFLIHLEPARIADVSKHRAAGIFFLSIPKLDSIPKLIDDFSGIIAGAESLQLRQDYLLVGQMDSALPPQHCLNKLDFELGRYAYKKNEEHTFNPKLDDVFLFRTADESFPLKIVAVNDRGHSKVFYEARLPFELGADGTVKGYDLADSVRSEITRALQEAPTREAQGPIENIPNDLIISERR